MFFQLLFYSFVLMNNVGAVDPNRNNTSDLQTETTGNQPAVVISRTSGKITIDGKLNESSWQQTAAIDTFTQVDPDEGEPASEKTEVRLLYDANQLYIGIHCFDSSPEKIVATQMVRDGNLGSDDSISIIIGPYHDQRNGYYFETNPLGVRGDALIEGSRFNKNWDGIWYCKTSRDESGWSAEIAIPFKTISFNPETDRWEFNIKRFIRRRNEQSQWASPSRDKRFNSFANAGLITEIHDIKQGEGLDIKPFFLSSFTRNYDTGSDDTEIDGGLDLFYKVTPSLTLAMTVNTDFAEAEVDDRRVNLTRFPLFFPEKRDFFLQDTGIFNFGGIRHNPLPFHSRRIGIGPDGEVRDILVGAKLTGRIGDLNLGLLDVQMKHDTELGDKNLFVGRASVNVLDESTVGTIFTAGDPATNGNAWTGGFDFNYNNSSFNGDKTLSGNVWILGSDSPGIDDNQFAYGIKLRYPNDTVSWALGYTRIDDNFDASLGFVPRRGINEYFFDWRYRFRPDSDVVRFIDTGASGSVITDLDGNVESRSLDIELMTLVTQRGDYLNVEYSREREVLDSNFEISSGVILPPSSYKYDRYRINLSTTKAEPIDTTVRFSGGDFFDGTREDYYLSVNWRPSRSLSISSDYTLNDIHLDEGNFLTRIIRARINVMFTPDLTWSTYTQYDNVSESIGINSRLHWIIEPGNEIYFVINQAIDRVDESFAFRETTATAKVGWTFRF